MSASEVCCEQSSWTQVGVPLFGFVLVENMTNLNIPKYHSSRFPHQLPFYFSSFTDLTSECATSSRHAGQRAVIIGVKFLTV